MRRISLRTLFGVPGKAIGAIVGVAAAGTLILAQTGLYAGFLRTSSALVARTGGDVWVMARGTEVLDNAARLAPETWAIVAGHPCVERVRGVIVDYAQVHKESGALVTVQIVGIDAAAATDPPMPWSMARGLPGDLMGPARVAVESLDLSTLGVTGDPIGAQITVSGQRATIAALTRGVRPFTQTPYLFAELSEARRLTRLPGGAVTFWVADLRDPACAAAVAVHATHHPDLDAHSTAEFAAMTRRFWVESSGVGAVLELGAALSLVVGMVVIAQTLSAITRTHLRELGTLKALGASSAELIRFVAWQAALLAVLGGLLALVLAFVLRGWLMTMGLEIVLSSEVVALGLTAIAAMCGMASLGSMRTVLALDAAEVLR